MLFRSAKEDLTITCAKQRMLRGETQYNPVSRFVKEIPEQLLDNKLPTLKIRDYVEYEDDSYERSHFKAKPFGMNYMPSESSDSGFTRNGASGDYQRIFDKNVPTARAKPKAVAVPKRTPAENRPFIAGGGVGSLGSVNGLSKGMPSSAHIDYGMGDRVKHIKYGEGTVANVEKDPRDYKVTVEIGRAHV